MSDAIVVSGSAAVAVIEVTQGQNGSDGKARDE
jgi:hypothetical protein